MNSMNLPQNKKSLLGCTITDFIRSSKKVPDLAYKYRNGLHYVFNNAPFKTVNTKNNTIAAVDTHKDTRKEARYKLPGLVFAAPNGDTEYTIVGDIVNISISAICIKPYRIPTIIDCGDKTEWRLYFDLGNIYLDTTGKIIRHDSEVIVFSYHDLDEKIKNYLSRANDYER